jgi:hypothetical protein
VEWIRRFIFNALTLMSLLLCVAICGLCVRSFIVADTFGEVTQLIGMRAWETADDMSLDISRGEISYLRWRCIDKTAPRRRYRFHAESETKDLSGPSPQRSWFGVIVQPGGAPVTINGRKVSVARGIRVVVPLWLPAMLTALLPTAWVLKRRRRRSAPARGFEVRPGVEGGGR